MAMLCFSDNYGYTVAEGFCRRHHLEFAERIYFIQKSLALHTKDDIFSLLMYLDEEKLYFNFFRKWEDYVKFQRKRLGLPRESNFIVCQF